MQSEPTTSSQRAVGAAWLAGTLSAAVLLMLPALLARLAEELSLTETQLGVFSFADLGGLTAGAAFGAHLLIKVGLRRLVRCGFALAALANLGCVPVTHYETLLVLRIGAGIGAGLVLAAVYVVLGHARRVDRSFAIFLLCQGIFSAMTLKSVPPVTELVGLGGVFAALAVLYAAAIWPMSALPSGAQGVHHQTARPRPQLAAYAGLAGILVFFMAQGGVWAYLELIGTRGGVDSISISNGLALSTLVGLLGPLTAAVIGQRWGRALPLCLGLGTTLLALSLLGSRLDGSLFTLAACLFNVAWNFTIPYQLATLSRAGAASHTVAWAASISLCGLAVGPLVIAFAYRAQGFHGVLWLSGVLCVASVAALTPALTKKLTTPDLPAASSLR